MIGRAELVRKAGLAQTMGISAKDFAELAKIAEAAAIRTGQSFDHMLESVVVGTARGSKMILDNLGIIIKGPFSMEAVKEAGADMIKKVEESGASATKQYARFQAAAEDLALTFNDMLRPAIEYLGPALEGASLALRKFLMLDDPTGATQKDLIDEQVRLTEEVKRLKRELESGPGGMTGALLDQEEYNTKVQRIDGLTRRIEYLRQVTQRMQDEGIGGPKKRSGPSAKDETAEHEEAAKREKAGLEMIAAIERQYQQVQRNIEAANRKREREQEEHLKRMEDKRKKDARDQERLDKETERRKQAFLMRMVRMVSSAYRQMTSVALQALEDFVAGQKVRLDAIAASVLKQAGTQTIGFGLALIAEGVANSMSSNPALVAQSPRQYAGGAALVGAGTAMGGAGAVWAGAIRRGEGGGGAGGEDDGGQVLRMPSGTRAAASSAGNITISRCALVLGDLSGAANQLVNTIQRGGDYLLGGGL